MAPPSRRKSAAGRTRSDADGADILPARLDEIPRNKIPLAIFLHDFNIELVIMTVNKYRRDEGFARPFGRVVARNGRMPHVIMRVDVPGRIAGAAGLRAGYRNDAFRITDARESVAGLFTALSVLRLRHISQFLSGTKQT